MEESKTSFSIKHWADDDQPREKLVHKGKLALSDAELIAILIGSGNREESAVALSKRILATVDNDLNKLGKLSLQQLMSFKGVGEAKAVTISAAMEMGRRRRADDKEKIPKILDSTSAYHLLHPILGELEHEEFWMILLNNANRVLGKSRLSMGGITSTVVDVRLAMKETLEYGAVGILLAHNHPSGNCNPSAEDLELTNKIKTAAAIFDIKVLDHLIITSSGYYSFADEGQL